MKIMQNTFRILIALSISVILFTACSSDDDESLQSENQEYIESSLFEEDAEGWKIVGDAQGGYVEPSYSPDGGVIGGYIYAIDDAIGGVWYFSAPQAYKGNKLEYYGATLSFSLFQESAMNNQFEWDDVFFKNGDKQITFQHGSENYPTSEWTGYSIPIKAGNGWLKGTSSSTEQATEADIKEVLSNVTDFWIRGEFQDGEDSGGMDKVIIEN